MEFTGLWRGLYRDGRDAMMRLALSPLKGGHVRQVGETSLDQGRTWQPHFDFTYVPRRP